MKTMKVLFMLIIVAVITACSKDENDDVMDITASSIAAMWRVTATDDGTGWKSCDAKTFEEAKWLILSEDGYYLSLLDFSIRTETVSGHYTFTGNTATLYDYYDNTKVDGRCVFTEVKQLTATATLTVSNGEHLNVRLYRDNRRPTTYRNPADVLKGKWQLTASEDDKSFDDYEQDTDGSAEFNGNQVTFNIQDTHNTCTFHRTDIFSIATDDNLFLIRQTDNPNEIEVHSQIHRKNYKFKRQ